jgi:methyl-accepting chemotaxis protein
VSQEVRSNIAEIAAGLGEISSSVQDVSLLAGKLGEAGLRLDSAINAFTT